jgi:glycosyltransferase involved in cell wall biosynthesis
VSFIEQTNVRTLTAAIGYMVPIIVSERIDPRRYDVGPAWNLARRLTYPFANRVVVQSESVARWAKGFLRADRVKVIPNFVRDLPNAVVCRSPFSLLAAGRLEDQKGFDLLLRAFKAAGLAGLGYRLTILGEGPRRPSLEALAGELGIFDAVSMPGVVSNPEDWMARSAIFVLPSRFEGFPNALMEAMGMGCAVVAADCESGPAEIVRDGLDGLLVPTEDVEALSGALLRLTNDEELRNALSAEAVNIRCRYSKEEIVTRWEDLVREVIQE